MTQITDKEIAKENLAKLREYFTFPTLNITIQYRRPDILKLSYNNALPTLMADAVIKSYKAKVEGRTEENAFDTTNFEATPEFLIELREKGYVLLEKQCTSHKILKVPESDIDNDVISWDDIPEEDAMAFLMHVINRTEVTNTSGGEVSVKEVTSFPDSKRKSKRGTTS